MSKCRNQECKDGSTPGVIASGKGTKMSPVVGASMRWGWVRCRACRPEEKDPPFESKSRTPQEIQERARLADNKSVYVANQVVNPRLAKIRLNTPDPPAAPPPDNSGQIAGLIDSVTKLSVQVAELLAENARLRSQGSPGPAEAPAPVPSRPPKRKSRQIAKSS